MVCRLIKCALWTMAISLMIAAAVWAEPQKNESPAPSSTPQSEEAKTPTAGVTSVDELKAKVASVEASTELGESVKKLVLGSLNQAIGYWEMVDRFKGELEQTAKRIEAAPERLREIENELDRPVSSPDQVQAEASSMKTEEIEGRMRQAEADLTAAKSVLSKWSDQLAEQLKRPQQQNEDMAKGKKRLDEIQSALGLAPPPQDPAALVEARRAALVAEKSKWQTQIALYEKQLEAHAVLMSLLTGERNLAAREVTWREALAKAWQAEAQKRRELEAKQARVEAEVAKQSAFDLPPAIREQLDINVKLGERLENLALEEKTLQKTIDETKARLKDIEEAFTLARQRVDTLVLTEAIGIAFREQRLSLPDLRDYRHESAKRRVKMSEIREAHFEADRQRRLLGDIDAETDRVVKSIDPPLTDAATGSLRAEMRRILMDRRDLLKKLQAEYSRHFANLQELEATEQLLVNKAERYADFLDMHLLWIRSSKVIGLRDIRALPNAVGWLTAPGRWWVVAKDTWSSFKRKPAWWVLALLFGWALVIGKRRALAELSRVAKDVAPMRTDSFMLTLRALVATLWLAAGWPFLMAFVGWQLSNLPSAGDLTRAVGTGLLATALHLAMNGFLYHLCREDGLAKVHFRWPAQALTTLRRELLWFLPWVLPLIFLVRLSEVAGKQEYLDSLGRLATIAIMVIFAGFIARVFRPSGGVMSKPGEGRPGGWTSRGWFIWYSLAVGSLLVLAVLTAYGYFYTAVVLIKRLYASFWLVILVIMAREFGLRWLSIAKRRLASYKAKQKREAARQAARDRQAEGAVSDPGFEGQEIIVEEPEVGFDQIDEQTRALMRTAVLFSAILGLWAIWAEVLPALNFLENIKLWTYSTQIDGVPQTLPITLGDLMLAIVLATITFVSARNLPGLLEITVLNRLSMDAGARYAMTTICRYAIFAIGVLLTFEAIGFSWSSVQWLIAALGVGLGFGLQEIVANFVSGLIVLFERPYRLGDVVKVGDISGKVTRIRIRATTITNWDRHELIVPNKEFITGKLINWTLSDPIIRLTIPVGIAYGSDTALAEELLLKVARETQHVLDQPEPSAFFLGFGDNSLNFELRVFIPDVNHWLRVTHQVHMAIDREFRQAGITIAFPQRDVHLDASQPLDVRLVPSGAGVSPTPAAGST